MVEEVNFLTASAETHFRDDDDVQRNKRFDEYEDGDIPDYETDEEVDSVLNITAGEGSIYAIWLHFLCFFFKAKILH